MGISASAILLGLSVLKRGKVQPRELAECFAGLKESPDRDQILGLQERLLRDDKHDTPALSRLSVESDFVPVYCPECGSRFRVYPWQIDQSDTCPACNASIAVPALRGFDAYDKRTRLRAAENNIEYRTAGSGRKFAYFDLVSQVGSGGAGTVYEAINNRNRRRVALKLLKFLPLEQTRSTWKRRLRETRLTNSVVDPHVVRVYDTALVEGRLFVEMEFMAGGSLRDMVEREGPPGVAEASNIVCEVLSGLSRAHRENVIHRDVKAGNILLDEKGRAKVSDFGLCKLLEESSSTTTGKLIGSPHFMAPEQWQATEIGPWTDIYAVGLVLYYVLTGHLAFEGENALSVMYQHLHSPVPDPRDWAPDTPAEVYEVLNTATAKKPDERFESAEEFRRALQSVS